MKTNIFKAIALGVLVWLSFAPAQLKAQAANPYMINNNTPCVLDIKYTIFDWNGTNCVPCDIGFISVPPGPPPTMINWNPLCSGCAVEIEILSVNGTAIPPIIAAFNNPPMQPHGHGPDPTGCSPTGMIHMNVHPHGADMHP